MYSAQVYVCVLIFAVKRAVIEVLVYGLCMGTDI